MEIYGKLIGSVIGVNYNWQWNYASDYVLYCVSEFFGIMNEDCGISGLDTFDIYYIYYYIQRKV